MATLVKEFDSQLDSRNRVTLRGATVDHYHVKSYSDGSFKFEPRVLVPLDVWEQIEAAEGNVKKGKKPRKLDLSKMPQV